MGNNKSRGKVQGMDSIHSRRLYPHPIWQQSYMDKIKPREIELEVKSINDVPNEVIQKNIMAYLSNDDISSFGSTGSKRFKVIADDELEKRRK